MDYNRLFEEDCVYQLQSKDIEELKSFLKKKKGWVYIASSKNNHLLKIGRTSKNPWERAKSLSSTGVLHDYQIDFALPVFNQFFVEKEIHKKLKKFRISKEFFSLKNDIAIEAMESVYRKEKELLSRFFNIEMVHDDIELLSYAIKNFSLPKS
jgi:hypothetical protein